MVKLGIRCHLIESAVNFIGLLSRPLTTHNEIKRDNHNLNSKWIQYFLDFYNERTNFLILANTKIYGSQVSDLNILKKDYKENYTDANTIFKEITENYNIDGDDKSGDISLDLSIFENDGNQDLLLVKIEQEKKNVKIEYGVFRLVLFIFQYLHVFEDKSINNNLWNYCLKSSTFSFRCFMIGLLTLICQYVWTGALIYNVIIDYHISSDISIILITIISTIISSLYSYETFSSFWSSVTLYKFLIKLYEDNPELELSREEEDYYYYKIRHINMRKLYIKYNLCADFLSNFILPIVLPILNIFVILNSETAIDAILNSMAIFFIVQIDEELYRITEYSTNQETIIFTRWVISTLYCKYFPAYDKIFKKECDTWHNSVMNLSNRYRKKSCNGKVAPDEEGYKITGIDNGMVFFND